MDIHTIRYRGAIEVPGSLASRSQCPPWRTVTIDIEEWTGHGYNNEIEESVPEWERGED